MRTLWYLFIIRSISKSLRHYDFLEGHMQLEIYYDLLMKLRLKALDESSKE